MSGLEKIFNNGLGSVQQMVEAYRDGKNVSAFGLQKSAKPIVCSLLGGEGKTLVVAPDFYRARELYEGLAEIEPGTCLLPARDDVLSYRDTYAGENVTLRLRSLYLIASGRARFAVCPVEAIMQLYPDREAYLSACMTVEKGKSYDLAALTERLIAAGYRREPQLTDAGRFSLRGDILDVWSIAESAPIRIEFFGDEVESIRFIDADSHSSREETSSCEIAPVTELFLNERERSEIIAELNAEASGVSLSPDARAKREALFGGAFERLSVGESALSLSYFLPYARHLRIFEFCPIERVIFDEAKQIFDNASVLLTETANRYKTMLLRGETVQKSIDGLLPTEKAFAFGGARLAFHGIMTANRLFTPDAVFDFKTKEINPYYKQITGIELDISELERRGYKIYFALGNDERYDFVFDYLKEHDIFVPRGYASAVNRVDFSVRNGAVFVKERVAVIGECDLVYKQVKKKIKRSKSDVFFQPEPGDYVVHEIHGIGRFEGIVKVELDGLRRDYALVSYAGTDKLYVPVENLDSLSKYAAGEHAPVLSKLGGRDFARVKERVKGSVKKLAVELVELYGKRLDGRGHRYNEDDGLLREFEESFEFAETDDQLVAINDALCDLKKGKIMDRLLCGDVGYGKTEVALRIAFKVIAEGKQVAFLSPTTILAKQHYETVKGRMEPFGVIAGRLTRFDSKAEQEKTIASLKAGKTDIVVGTHRLLSKDVGFADLGLLILDEEQRFGVADKEKIKVLKNDVNVLTLSATPIPRTLHMSLTGIRDVSVLDTPPAPRIPIQTYVSEYSETLLTDAVDRELNRGGQVFIVYNRVRNMPEFAARLQALLPSARIVYAHGQMDERALEERVEAFVKGEYDVMLSSTIIENGIDIPRANTMLVVDADKLGLAQLYQLRGRVGRSDRLAYVYFTFDGRKTLSDAAYKRLEAITQFTEFGSGFKIAMRDLEIRGAGSVLGAEQHGHMEKVGYDMYCRLLAEAVGELKGEKTIKRGEVRASVDYAMFVPDGYITDRDWRLRIYSRISKVETLKEREELLSDMADIYGPVPDSVKNLVDVALIKNLAAYIGAAAVTLKKREFSVSFARVIDIENEVNAEATRQGGRLSLDEPPRLKFSGGTKMLKFLLNCRKLKP